MPRSPHGKERDVGRPALLSVTRWSCLDLFISIKVEGHLG